MLGTFVALAWFWIFDAMDGCYARMYGQVSTLGMYLDPVKDAVVTILIMGVIYWRYKDMMSMKCWVVLAAAYLFFSLLQPLYYTCQDCDKKRKGEQTSDFFKPFHWVCGEDPQRKMKALRFATGVTNILLLFVIFIMLEHRKRSKQ
jgi:phosphatidylglycerophosphate synthase